MSAVNQRAAWWGQSHGFPATLDGAQAAIRRHGSWEYMAFISRCVRQAEAVGMRPAADRLRFDAIVQREAIADTLRRFPA